MEEFTVSIRMKTWTSDRRLYAGIKTKSGHDFHFLHNAKPVITEPIKGYFRMRLHSHGGCYACDAAQYSPHSDCVVCYKNEEERTKTPGCRRAVPDSAISAHTHLWQLAGSPFRVQFTREGATLTEVKR